LARRSLMRSSSGLFSTSVAMLIVVLTRAL
jgi:hypothetical protein